MTTISRTVVAIRSSVLVLILTATGCFGQLDDDEYENTEDVGSGQQALSSCISWPSAANCDGWDPVAAGCDIDAITLKSKTISGWPWPETLDQRYSPKCKSRWTRYTSTIYGLSTVKITRVSPNLTLTWTHNGTLNYTDMVYCPRTTCGASSAVTRGSVTTSLGTVY